MDTASICYYDSFYSILFWKQLLWVTQFFLSIAISLWFIYVYSKPPNSFWNPSVGTWQLLPNKSPLPVLHGKSDHKYVCTHMHTHTFFFCTISAHPFHPCLYTLILYWLCDLLWPMGHEQTWHKQGLKKPLHFGSCFPVLLETWETLHGQVRVCHLGDRRHIACYCESILNHAAPGQATQRVSPIDISWTCIKSVEPPNCCSSSRVIVNVCCFKPLCCAMVCSAAKTNCLQYHSLYSPDPCLASDIASKFMKISLCSEGSFLKYKIPSQTLPSISQYDLNSLTEIPEKLTQASQTLHRYCVQIT